MNIPNALTITRLLLAPVVVWLILNAQLQSAALVFAFAAATDALDGWLARHWHESTTFGQFADPVADKVLLSGTFAAFGMTGVIPWWLVLVVFGRDLYLLLATVIAMRFTRLREYRPTIAGKLYTAIQVLYVVMLLAGALIGSSKLHNSLHLLVWPMVLLAAWTGLHYTVRGILRLTHD